MEQFATTELKLAKSVKSGDKESPLSLFSAAERFRHFDLLADANEDATVKVTLEGLGEVDLKLGADMEKGQKKTIMTLFWFAERSKDIEMMRDAEAGESLIIKMQKL
jgi:hypothetical protein